MVFGVELSCYKPFTIYWACICNEHALNKYCQCTVCPMFVKSICAVFYQVKSPKGPPTRATILLTALKDLSVALLSNPVDGNLICAVKLLKV